MLASIEKLRLGPADNYKQDMSCEQEPSMYYRQRERMGCTRFYGHKSGRR